jgi:hypothetical protein
MSSHQIHCECLRYAMSTSLFWARSCSQCQPVVVLEHSLQPARGQKSGLALVFLTFHWGQSGNVQKGATRFENGADMKYSWFTYFRAERAGKRMLRTAARRRVEARKMGRMHAAAKSHVKLPLDPQTAARYLAVARARVAAIRAAETKSTRQLLGGRPA